MKQIRTWINEEQYKTFQKIVEKKHQTEYAVTKQLVVDFLEKRKEQNKKFLILYFFIIYSLITTGILLFL